MTDSLAKIINSEEIYNQYRDEELIEFINKGNTKVLDFLINKYKGLVKIKTREYFILGADKEDLIQEGMIGLYKAIRDYKADKLTPFYYFAELCVTRQIISAIKAASRQKHLPLNAYVSLSKSVYDEGSAKTFLDVLAEERVTNPEELFIGQEGKNYIEEHVPEILSELECKVLALHLQGKSYLEIATIVSKDEKSIDNAIQRVRRKIDKFLNKKNPALN